MKSKGIQEYGSGEAGFSLHELVVGLVVVSFLAGLIWHTVSDMSKNVRREKLIAQTHALNRAAKAYTANGGDLSTATTTNAAIAKLKTRSMDSEIERIVGLRGRFVDPRLKGVFKAAETGEMRAVWNATTQRFQLLQGVDGVSEFTLDGDIIPVQEESRQQRIEYAAFDNWIWDYGNIESYTRPAYAGGHMDQDEAPADPMAQIGDLSAPIFSFGTGTYDIEMYDSLSLSDPNPPGLGMLYFSMDGGTTWEQYAGGSFNISTWPVDLEARVVSIDPDDWNDSSETAENFNAVWDPLISFTVTPSLASP